MTQQLDPSGEAQPLDQATASSYALLGFLMLLNVMNFVDRQLLASFANFIVPDLGLTNTEFGLLTGFAFIVFYSVAGLFMGALADMVHRPRLIAAGLMVWSLLTAASGAAKGFATLAIPRIFIGIGESTLTPTSMSLLADKFPASRLGFASGAYYMGVPVGIGVSLLIAGYLGPAIGWRNCFYALGALGVLLAVGTLFIREVPRRQHGPVADTPPAADKPASKPKFREIVATLSMVVRSSPSLVYTMLGGVALHFIIVAGTYDQLWFVQERGFERADIAMKSGWIAVVAGVLGNLCGGIGSDIWHRRTGQSRAMFLFWFILVLAPINLVYRLVEGDSLLFWLGLFAGFFQVGLFYGPSFSTVQELVPPKVRATVIGFYLLVLNLLGVGATITAGGIMIDYLMSAGIAEPYTWTLFVLTASSLLSLPLFYLAGRRYEVDRERLMHLTEDG